MEMGRVLELFNVGLQLIFLTFMLFLPHPLGAPLDEVMTTCSLSWKGNSFLPYINYKALTHPVHVSEDADGVRVGTFAALTYYLQCKLVKLKMDQCGVARTCLCEKIYLKGIWHDLQ